MPLGLAVAFQNVDSIACITIDNIMQDSLCTKNAFVSLSINLNMCCGCSKEPSHLDGSFEYPQHMFWLRNKKNIFFSVRTLIWKPKSTKLNSRKVVAF